MNKLFGISLLALVFASCQNTGDRKATAPAAPAPTTFATPQATVLDSNNQATLNTNTNGAATASLNPEHGAPGHRCDIPVGAPLGGTSSSAPANSAPAISNDPAPVILKAPNMPQPATNNARLNPAHGAPGHDCSIPVGQPLKS